MELSRELAICMCFYVEYTEENVKECTEAMNRLGDVEICYNTDPKEPIIVAKERIRRMPNSYHLYPVILTLL